MWGQVVRNHRTEDGRKTLDPPYFNRTVKVAVGAFSPVFYTVLL